MKLSKRSIKTLRASDSTSLKTVKFLERLGLIEAIETWAGRTRASGSDGLPGKKNYKAGEFIYGFRLTEAGKRAIEETSIVKRGQS